MCLIGYWISVNWIAFDFTMPAGKSHRRYRKGKDKTSYSKSFTKNSLDLAFKRRWYAYTQRSFREEAHGRRSIEEVFADQQQMAQMPPGITVLQVREEEQDIVELMYWTIGYRLLIKTIFRRSVILNFVLSISMISYEFLYSLICMIHFFYFISTRFISTLRLRFSIF